MFCYSKYSSTSNPLRTFIQIKKLLMFFVLRNTEEHKKQSSIIFIRIFAENQYEFPKADRKFSRLR